MTAGAGPVIFRSVGPIFRFRVQNQGFLPYLTVAEPKGVLIKVIELGTGPL